jgi:hypothetical protein
VTEVIMNQKMIIHFSMEMGMLIITLGQAF